MFSSEHLSILSLSNCVIMKNYQCLEVGMGTYGESQQGRNQGGYSHFKFGNFWRWFKWRLSYLKIVFSTGDWSVNTRPSRWLPEGKPLPLPASSHAIHHTSQRRNWDPLCFNCFIVTPRAQPMCGAAVSPLLLGVSHATEAHIGEAIKHPLSVA